MKIKRIIYTCFLIVWMIIIFIFSNQDANKSESTSDKVTSTVIDTVQVVTKQDITKEKKSNLIEDTRVLVRKSAHFFLFLILGILIYLTLSSYSIPKTVLFSIIFCFMYACSDELHQLFTNGRTAKVLDVFVDTCGSVLAIIICHFIKRFKNKKSIAASI